MLKKVIGGLFFAGAAGLLASSLFTGSLFEDKGSTAATYGAFIGALIPVILYILSGVFFLTFDKPRKASYTKGFKKRGTQLSLSLIFITVYLLLIFLVAISTGRSGVDNYLLVWLIGIIPYFIPLMIFVYVFILCGMPYFASKKHFIKNDAALNAYLSETVQYDSCTSDHSVLVSNKALFFSKTFCVVPFDQIKSIKRVNELGIQYTYFYLHNGKKFYVTTKYYNEISAAIESHQSDNQ